MAALPLSLRKGYLRANLQFVLNDVLKTCTFVTADYLAEQYKIVFKDSLEIALQTCEEEDLFSFIQNEFADTFFVHKESEPRGLLRKNAVNKPLPVAQNAPRRAIDYEKSAGSPAPRAVEVDLDYDSGSQYSRPPSRAPIVTEELCSSPSVSSLNTSRAELIIDQHITVPKEEPADFVEELRPGFANVGIGEMRSRSRSQSSKEGVATVPEVSADISLKNEMNAAIPMPGPASESFRKSLSVDTPPPGFEMPQKPPGFEMPKKPPGFEMLQKPPGFGMPQKPPGFDDVAPVRTPSVTSASNADVGENIEEASVRPASDEVPDDTAGLLKFLEDVNKKREENEREANNAENVRQTAEYIGTPNSPQNNTSSEDLREGSVRGDQTPDLVRTTKPYYDPDFEEDYDDVVAQNSPELNGYTVNDNAKNVRASSPKLSKSPESPAIKSKRVTEPHYKLVDGYIEIYDTIYRHKGQYVSKIMENWENESIPLPWLNITNLGDVLAILRRLHKLYPEGCTAEELYQFDNTLRTFNEGNGHFSQISSLPSMALVIENGMLVVEAHELDQQVVHRFHVCPQALNIEIVQMRKNLCSNLYRVLRNNNGTLRVKDVMEYWNQLVLVPFGKSAETILKVCNRYPLVFQLKSNRTDEYCFETSSLCITEGLSDWRVVLDCEINDMPAILCDCSECV